ncbi:hypothetical protein J7438_04965 [Thalassotalea sp. G20_0]|uniref:hypothetical protein n=1 Tax=Thalassotalea sp. G20_0 TaxID=2821093 RepID=UPI001ADA85F6|nr:hypothetical protein [Thalassotalea sp. G20_0]MBO9493437.1 hypothetical protein [Thalassotalea sp. G20_0]
MSNATGLHNTAPDNQEPQKKELDNVDLKLEGRDLRWLEKVARAPQQEPWSVIILQYAWTAGPVTLMAAYFGYYFAYGEMMPIERAFYFLGYSVIAVALGMGYRLFHNMTHGRQQVRERISLLNLIDQISELIYQVRDLGQANMTEEQRRIHSAGILLRKLDLGPEWVAAAIEDLTGNQQLAKQAERIEIFRRAGLYNRMQDIIHEARDEADNAWLALNENHPRTAEALKKRLNGIVARPHDGQKREPLFIERILSAIEEGNENLMTLHDVEEILTLCFELICGREIAYLKIEYTGHWDLARALDKLEEERNDLRISRARVYSRLKALTTYLNNIGIPSDIGSGNGLSTHKLLATATKSLDNLSLQVREARQLTLSSPQKKTAKKHLLTLTSKSQQLEKALQIYNESRRAYLKQGRDSLQLKRALKNWQKLSSKYQYQNNENLKRSLTISEQTIFLDVEAKAEVTQRILHYLNESPYLPKAVHETLSTDDNSQINSVKTDAGNLLAETGARDIAIEIATILDPYIHLHDPQIQRAIESANATSLANIEPGMSARTKAAWGEAMAGAVAKNLAASAEKLAQNLIRYYRVPLSDQTINFLVKTYSASLERLQFIARYETPLSASYSLDNVSAMEVPGPKDTWQIDLYNAKKTITRLSLKGMA